MDEIGNIKQANSIIINPTTCKCKIVCDNIIRNVYMYVSWCTRWKLWSNEVLCLFSDFIVKRIEKYLKAPANKGKVVEYADNAPTLTCDLAKFLIL